MNPQTHRFEAQDGWALEGDLYLPDNPKAVVMISAGTGFPRQFYGAFARYAAAQGYAAFTYDYRGIGGSRAAQDAFLDIEYKDLFMDQVAALDLLDARFPNLPIYHVAHSVGGHFIGLWPNHARVAKHAFVSIGIGYFGAHHKSYWPSAMLFWWGIGGYSLMRHGYVKSGRLWRGADLPPKLFRTWRKWAHRPSYFADELKEWEPHHYNEVKAPIHSWLFTDDPIATEKSAPPILALYPGAETSLQMKSPQDYGLGRIGHDGAFRKGREVIWDEVLGWFEGETA